MGQKIQALFVAALLLFSHALSALDSWAQTTLNNMSLDEKIGQLFMVAGYVDSDFALHETASYEIDSAILGGVCLVGPSESVKQVALLNRLQEESRYPLLVAQDFEWGLAMRLTDCMSFPKNMTLGALSDNSLIYEMGKEIARQAKLVGVHVNLSPDIDVNIEPKNPVINVRSFGASPQDVALKGVAMIQGLQDGGIIASAKHFPGLGDIAVDPHLALPVNLHDRARLEEVEFLPFYAAIAAGVLSIQTDHVLFPALDTAPSSLSSAIVQGILKDKMGFTGLVLSGALRMKALSEHMSQEEIALQAFLAGSDMLLMPKDFSKSFSAIKTAILEKIISEDDVNQRVLKILQLKERQNLHENRFTPIPSADELHTEEAKALKKRLYQAVVQVERDENSLLPITTPAAYVQIGGAKDCRFYKELHLTSLQEDEDALLEKLEEYATIIVALFPLDPKKSAHRQHGIHGITEETASLLTKLERFGKKIVLCYFGNPFGLPYLSNFPTLINAYEDDEEAQIAASRRLFPLRSPRLSS